MIDKYADTTADAASRDATRDRIKGIILDVIARLRDLRAATGEPWHELAPIAEWVGLPCNVLTRYAGMYPKTLAIRREVVGRNANTNTQTVAIWLRLLID